MVIAPPTDGPGCDFDEEAGALFSNHELANFLVKALNELDGFADASCENQVGADGECGHCSVCSARKVIDDIDRETRRRRAAQGGAP